MQAQTKSALAMLCLILIDSPTQILASLSSAFGFFDWLLLSRFVAALLVSKQTRPSVALWRRRAAFVASRLCKHLESAAN